MIVLTILAGLTWAAECQFPHQDELPFSITMNAPSQSVPLFELWLDMAAPIANEKLLRTFEDRNISIIVTLPPPPEDGAEAWTAAAHRAIQGEHALSMQIADPPGWNAKPFQSVRTLKTHRKRFKQLVGRAPLAATIRLPNKQAEATVLKAGFDVVLEIDGPFVDKPRLSAYYPNQIAMGIIIPNGAYAEHCEAPLQWTSSVADRVAQTLMNAQGGSFTTTRIKLTQDQPNISALAIWLDENYLQQHQETTHPNSIRSLPWKRAIHRGEDDQPIHRSPATGRRFPERYVREIAETIVSSNPLPRTLPHGLNLTEGYAALVSLLAKDAPGPVLLTPLAPPQQLAVSQWTANTGSVARESVVAMAKRLGASPGQQVPAALRIDDTPFTAAEFLVLMSQAALGQEKPTVGLIRVPDPRSDDLGWGRSGP